jgi:co-chaperonin GroES (HSP10)
MARHKEIERKIVSSKIRPVRKDGVFVLWDEIPKEVVADSGVVIPGDAAMMREDRIGTVVAVGVEAGGVQVGNRVLMHKGYNFEIPHDDSATCRLVYVSEDQIDAVMTGDAERDDYEHYKTNF